MVQNCELLSDDELLFAYKETTVGELEFNTENLSASYFCFTNSKKNYIKSIYAHLRNSFAHGLFTKKEIEKTVFYSFNDNHNKKTTMRGQMQKEFFVEFIDKLKQAKK